VKKFRVTSLELRIVNFKLRFTIHDSRITILLFVLCSTLYAGCSYSFTGSSVPPHLKTVAVPLFDDQSGFGEPNLREKFTNKLIEKIQSDNSLQIGEKATSDAELQGNITSVNDAPAVVNPGETVSKRKVTITISASFYDKVLKKKMWEKSFSNWGNYETGSGIAERTKGIDEAMEKITEDILLETVSGW